ncbi:tripartite tricarboxylate transporter substrate binding protein [Roseomonas sp. PWR1]|uniref:Tripartite tricarboxylate transporter substrate binding protein n=1 Tax=Roseomonas nitratireducens TaxID=2820810 RepID=A0ABS4ATV2_9PROT|nr:tripartite tricarboxylate transporter substrate-binding protein [Neoroseomonas nitratireducens]MBP0464684.1 tripartite tricarboxylate transporter substrate binding protein [Neoroseomonas nitratireducens]
MKTARRALLATPFAAALAAPARAQAPWPTRPVRLISPFAPGGPQDVPARYFVDYLTPRLGQPVVYDSRAGAGGQLGMQHVATATDGHSFLITSNSVATLPALRRDLGFDPFTDLLPVTIVTEAPLVYCVRANGPANLAAFIARAKEAPGRVSVGSSGIGSATHLASAFLMQKAGIELLHVPYRGAGLIMTALLAGEIDAFVGDLSLALEHIRAGTIRPIGVTTQARAPLLPDVPAIGEQIAGYAVPFWFGLFAAKQTAPEAIRRMNAELAPLAAPTSELSRRMADRGSLLVLSGPDPLAARLRAEVAQWRQVVQAAGITPE